MTNFPKRYFATVSSIAFILILSAIFHKVGIDSNGYKGSPLIMVQIYSLIALLISIPVSIVIGIRNVYKKERASAKWMLLSMLIAFSAYVAAIIINPATLNYAT